MGFWQRLRLCEARAGFARSGASERPLRPIVVALGDPADDRLPTFRQTAALVEPDLCVGHLPIWRPGGRPKLYPITVSSPEGVYYGLPRTTAYQCRSRAQLRPCGGQLMDYST